MVIDKARQLGTILIIKAAHITERLGDDITLTEICREAGVVNRRISTVCYCLWRRAGLGGGKITNNSKMIGDKIVNRYSCNKLRGRGSNYEIKYISAVVCCICNVLS